MDRMTTDHMKRAALIAESTGTREGRELAQALATAVERRRGGGYEGDVECHGCGKPVSKECGLHCFTRAAEAYGYEPARVASCTCGAIIKAPTLREVNAAVEQHVEEGTEGCDHAVYIESSLLDDKERHA